MTFAQFVGNGSSGLIGMINVIVVPFIGSLAFIFFVWGLVNYFFFNSGSEEKRAEGRQFAIWGIIGLVVFFSIWGFVNLLLSTLGIAPTS